MSATKFHEDDVINTSAGFPWNKCFTKWPCHQPISEDNVSSTSAKCFMRTMSLKKAFVMKNNAISSTLGKSFAKWHHLSRGFRKDDIIKGTLSWNICHITMHPQNKFPKNSSPHEQVLQNKLFRKIRSLSRACKDGKFQRDFRPRHRRLLHTASQNQNVKSPLLVALSSESSPKNAVSAPKWAKNLPRCSKLRARIL